MKIKSTENNKCAIRLTSNVLLRIFLLCCTGHHYHGSRTIKVSVLVPMLSSGLSFRLPHYFSGVKGLHKVLVIDIHFILMINICVADTKTTYICALLLKIVASVVVRISHI